MDEIAWGVVGAVIAVAVDVRGSNVGSGRRGRSSTRANGDAVARQSGTNTGMAAELNLYKTSLRLEGNSAQIRLPRQRLAYIPRYVVHPQRRRRQRGKAEEVEEQGLSTT